MIAITDKKRLLISSIFIFAIFLTSCTKTPQSATTIENNSIASKVGGLTSALISRDSYKCKYVNNQDQSTGEYLVKNNKYRVSGQNGASDGSSTIISNEKGTYIWTLGDKQGIFYPKTEDSKEDKTTNTNNSEFDNDFDPEKLDNKEKIDCQKSLVDDSEFSPPSDVEFQDFTVMMNNLANPGGNGTSMPDIDSTNLPSN